jgi:hypothetical protein
VSIPACVEIEYQGKVKISVTLTFTLYTPGGGFWPRSWINFALCLAVARDRCP